MRPRFLSISILIMLTLLLAVSSSMSKEVALCERFGVITAMYFDETPKRLLIYDAGYKLSQSVSIYRYSKKSQDEPYEEVGLESLGIGKTLSYKVTRKGREHLAQIEAAWIIPNNHCRSSE